MEYNLSALNPWWTDRQDIEKDDKVVDFNKKRYKYLPELITYDYKPGNIYSIRGPRQLGKTTAVKLIIKRLLLEKNVDRLSIFFWSCEDISDFNQLVYLIESYLEIAEEKEVSEKYIFLDEISFVSDWQRGIKLLVDRGRLKDTCLVLTGSNMLDIKLSVERLPGRRGKEGKDFTLLPLNFCEFCKLLGFSPEIRTVGDLKTADRKLRSLFIKYTKTGGFPLVINEFMTDNNPTWLKEVYYSWIIGDLLRGGKSERIALQAVSSLIRRQPSALSWGALAKDAEIKSHITIFSYMDTLEGMFVLKIDYFYDLDKRTENPNKNKKIHFLDNYIYKIFCEKVKTEVKKEVMHEDMVSFHLYKQLKETYYTVRKKEIDFVIIIDGKTVGIEVKSGNKTGGENFPIRSLIGRYFLITDNSFQSFKRYYAIPIHWFLYLNIRDLLRIFKMSKSLSS